MYFGNGKKGPGNFTIALIIFKLEEYQIASYNNMNGIAYQLQARFEKN